MNRERLIFLGGVGEVAIRRRKGAKRLTIRINHKGKVSITIPQGMRDKEAQAFLHEKKDWIIKTKDKIQREKPAEKIYSPDEEFLTRFHKIKILSLKIDIPDFIINKNECVIRIPSHYNYKEKKIQEFIRIGVAETLRKEAKEYLVPRVGYLAGIHGFSFGMVRVKNLKSRWGSCSIKNNINLNIHLMRLPEQLSDYVILHELVHTIHKNHSAGFWQTLDYYCPGAKNYSRELKKYRTEI